MRKYITILLLFLFIECTHEKEFQVTMHTWILIAKKPATRWPDIHFVWLVFQRKDGLIFRREVSEEQAEQYLLGMKVLNMDTK